MQNKKGAIQLSMSTIIVVILGITLLSLGLVWVRGTLDKVTKLSDEAFALSEQEIQNLFSNTDSLILIKPNSVDLKNGKGIDVGVIFYNNRPGAEVLSIQADVNSIAAGSPLNCRFVDTLTKTSKEYRLKSGESHVFELRIETTDETYLGAGGCDVVITDETYSDQVLVNVI